MAEIFETLSPGPAGKVKPAGRIAELPASDLTKIASRAQQRQQSIVDQSLSPSDSELFPVTPTHQRTKLAPGLYGLSGQAQGVGGVTNTVSNDAIAGSAGQSAGGGGVVDDLFDAPTRAPSRLESEPEDVGYADLSPTQRNSALRSTGMDVVDYAVDPETRQMRRASSGAAVLAFKSPIGGQQVFLAEDGAPAHAALMKAVNDSNVRALPVDGRDDYEVGWRVHPDDMGRFRAMVNYLEPGSAVADGDTFRVSFSDSNSLNRAFMRAPFGSRRKAGR